MPRFPPAAFCCEAVVSSPPTPRPGHPWLVEPEEPVEPEEHPPTRVVAVRAAHGPTQRSPRAAAFRKRMVAASSCFPPSLVRWRSLHERADAGVPGAMGAPLVAPARTETSPKMTLTPPYHDRNHHRLRLHWYPQHHLFLPGPGETRDSFGPLNASHRRCQDCRWHPPPPLWSQSRCFRSPRRPAARRPAAHPPGAASRGKSDEPMGALWVRQRRYRRRRRQTVQRRRRVQMAWASVAAARGGRVVCAFPMM